ncbi:MAG: Hsp20/alpha crystallin family protein [Flavipsychrobacter sp.]|nr:Hsp20/alpha crystallin family protein [Flavipsychrobacter sp.]
MTSVMKKSNGNTPASFTGLVDQIFQNNLSRFFEDDFWGFNGVNRRSTVPLNIRETDRSYEMELVAPGLKKEDFRISVTGDMLTVSFEHKEEANEQDRNKGWLRKEYRVQSFTRSFNLDDTVDVNGISADYRDGILHLSLPKKEDAQKISREITIQ